jgi:hypothetical protein
LNLSVFNVTIAFSFQELLKRIGAAQPEEADAGSGGHSGEAVNSEAARIMDEAPLLRDPKVR